MLKVNFIKSRRNGRIRVYCFISVFILISMLLCSVANASTVAGLDIQSPELVYTTGSAPANDGSLCTWKKDNNNLYVLNAKWDDFQLYYGPISNPYQNYVGKSTFNHNGWIGLIWMSNVYKYSDGTLLGICHREAYWSDSSVNCFYLGLAKSTDNGLTWNYLGDVITPQVNYKEPVTNGVNSCAGNVAGDPYLIVGEYLYLYYNDQTGTERRSCVARAKLSDIKTAIDANNVTPFYKYNNGTWTQPGMSGVGSNILPGGVISNTGLDYHPTHHNKDFHSDAAYCSALGKYLITVNYEDVSGLYLYSSTDGINWSEETVLDRDYSLTYTMWYSTFMSLSPGSSDDCSTVGNDFYIYYPHDISGTQSFYSIHFTVGTGMTNDDNAAVSYSSGWSDSNSRGLGDYSNDVHYTQTNEAYCEYTFTGTGIGFYSEKAADMGNVDIYIDNVLKTNVNLYNAARLSQQLVYSINNLSNDSHTIKIVNKTSGIGIIDSFKVYTPITVNDDNKSIIYSNGWGDSNSRGLGDYNDDVHYTYTNGATAQYTFTGTGIDYISEKAADMGNVDIYIDNVFKQNVNLNNSTRLLQQTVYSFSGLTEGSHTIKIVNKTSGCAIIDAFKVYHQ